MSDEKNDFQTLVSYIKYVITLTFSWFSIVAAIFVFFLWSDRKEMKSDVQAIRDAAEISIGKAEEEAQEKIKDIASTVDEAVRRRVNERFDNDPEIQQLIRVKADLEIQRRADQIRKEMDVYTQEVDEAIEISVLAARMVDFQSSSGSSWTAFVELRDMMESTKLDKSRRRIKEIFDDMCRKLVHGDDLFRDDGWLARERLDVAEDPEARFDKLERFFREAKVMSTREIPTSYRYMQLFRHFGNLSGLKLCIYELDEMENYVESERRRLGLD